MEAQGTFKRSSAKATACVQSPLEELKANEDKQLVVVYVNKSGKKNTLYCLFNSEDQDQIDKGLVMMRASHNVNTAYYIKLSGIVSVKASAPREDEKYGYTLLSSTKEEDKKRDGSNPITGHMWRVAFLTETNDPDRPFEFIGAFTIVREKRYDMGMAALEIAKLSGLEVSHVAITYKGEYGSAHVNPRMVPDSSDEIIKEINVPAREELEGMGIYRAAVHQSHGVLIGTLLLRADSERDATFKAHKIATLTGTRPMLATAKIYDRVGAAENKDYNKMLHSSVKAIVG